MKVRKKKRKNNRLLIILMFLVLISIVYSLAPNYKKMQQNKFAIVYNNEDRTDEIIQTNKIQQKEIYLELQDVQNLFEQDIYIDETNKWLVTTSTTKVVAMNIEEPIIEVNSVEIVMDQGVIYEEGKYYIPILELEKGYNIDVEYIEETNRVVIELKDKKLISADVNKKVKVKEEAKNFSRTIENVKKGESIIWISNQDGWAKVRTKNGNIGYIKEKNLTNFYTIRENMDSNNSEEYTDARVVNIKELKNIKSIKTDDINKYQVRQKTIEKIVDQCIVETVQVLELQDTTLQQQDEISYNRFRQELQARLNEVGIKLK